MIKISVDTERELEYMRRVLRDEACSHSSCGRGDKDECPGCTDSYFKDKVTLYKREIVETQVPLVL